MRVIIALIALAITVAGAITGAITNAAAPSGAAVVGTCQQGQLTLTAGSEGVQLVQLSTDAGATWQTIALPWIGAAPGTIVVHVTRASGQLDEMTFSCAGGGAPATPTQTSVPTATPRASATPPTTRTPAPTPIPVNEPRLLGTGPSVCPGTEAVFWVLVQVPTGGPSESQITGVITDDATGAPLDTQIRTRATNAWAAAVRLVQPLGVRTVTVTATVTLAGYAPLRTVIHGGWTATDGCPGYTPGLLSASCASLQPDAGWYAVALTDAAAQMQGAITVVYTDGRTEQHTLGAWELTGPIAAVRAEGVWDSNGDGRFDRSSGDAWSVAEAACLTRAPLPTATTPLATPPPTTVPPATHGPTAITLTRASAASANGQTTVTWETGSEANTAAFVVSIGCNTPTPLATVAAHGPHRRYTAEVTAVGCVYLDEIETTGTRHRYGPIPIISAVSAPRNLVYLPRITR